MPKLIIAKGLPASGKSTVAEERIKKDGNTIRINKDLLRKMLHFDKFTGVNEGYTRNAARELARIFLRSNVNVIIDDTNLNTGTMQSWKDLGKEMDAKIEIMDLIDVSIEECISRDMKRENQVGEFVIKNMAIKAGIKTFEKDSIVLCDIDGTVADIKHRLHYVKSEKKDWKGFFSNMEDDVVREEIKDLIIDHFNKGKTIIFLSGRPENYSRVTSEWLIKNGLGFAYTIIMRKGNDKRPDDQTKRDLFNEYFPDKEVISMIYDDRPRVIRIWQELGLKVVDVGFGVDF